MSKKKVNVERAWKDEEYFANLSPAEQASVPPNPAGIVELSDEDLEEVAGGQTGTGSSECFCVMTKTADSNGGHCDCHCLLA